MPVCSPEDEGLPLLCFADFLGRDQCSTEMEDSGVAMIHVGDSGKKNCLKNGLSIPNRHE